MGAAMIEVKRHGGVRRRPEGRPLVAHGRKRQRDHLSSALPGLQHHWRRLPLMLTAILALIEAKFGEDWFAIKRICIEIASIAACALHSPASAGVTESLD
jgi:hypothetical protein